MTRRPDTSPAKPPSEMIDDAAAEARQLLATVRFERAAWRQEQQEWGAVQKEIGALRSELNALPEAMGIGVQNGLTETLATLRTITTDLQAAARPSPPPPVAPAGPLLALVGMIAAFFCGLHLSGPVTVTSGDLSLLPPASPPVIEPAAPPRPLHPPPVPWSPGDLR